MARQQHETEMPVMHRGARPGEPGLRLLRRRGGMLIFFALALAVAFKLLDLAWLIARPLALLLVAIVLAEALAPLVSRLSRRLPRPLAIGLVYLALVLISAVIGWIMIPGLIGQGQEVAANAPDILQSARRWIDRFGPVGSGQITDFLTSRAGHFSDQLVAIPLTIASSAFEIFAVIFLSVYWLIEAPDLRRFALSLCPERHQEKMGEVLSEMGRSMGGYIRGTVLNGLIIGGLAYVGYLIIGLRYPLVLALVAGTMELVPVLGPIIAAIPTVLIALTDSPTKALIVLAFWVALQQAEGHLVTPNVMRSQTDVPQLLVLFALLAGGALGGILGALVAIPVSGALRVLVLRVLAPALRRNLADEDRDMAVDD
jgi:predicted PurR-regulated permease PerM